MKTSMSDVLKKLNKGREELDQIKMAAQDNFDRGSVSTGSPMIDLKTGGGFSKGGYNTIIGEGGSGKSSIALLAIKSVQKEGKYGVYVDGERTLTESYIGRMGVNKDLLLVLKTRNLEEMLDTVEEFSKADDVGVIVLDSVNIFFATAVEEKSASDNHMAIEAKKWTTRMPIIEGNAAARGICLIGLTSYKLDPGSMGDPRMLSRGRWQYTMSNVILEITKRGTIFDDKQLPIGHELDFKVKKSKNCAYDSKKSYSTKFYNMGGFNRYDEYTKYLIDVGVIHKSGAWYLLPNGEKLQGESRVAQFFSDNEEYLASLLKENNIE